MAPELDSGGVAETGLDDPDPPLSPGEPVGEHVIVRLLGRGATGAVYEARHAERGQGVAIKVLHRRCALDPRALARFAGEARAVRRIAHPNIVAVRSAGELPDGRRYHVMDLVSGGTLAELLARRGGPLLTEEALPLLRGIADALEAAHAQGIVHRDLKPENVLVARDDRGACSPRLVDFGLAKLLTTAEGGGSGTLTETGAILGTPHYMAPEQSKRAAVDHRADVYAFGVVTYRVLTGRLPFAGDDPLEVLLSHRRDAPPPPSVVCPALPPAVDAAILAMLEKAPEKRPASAAAAFAAVERALQAAGVAGVAGSSADVSSRSAPGVARAAPVGHERALAPIVLVATIGAVAAAAVGLGLVWAARESDARARTPPSETRAPFVAPPRTAATAEQGRHERAIATSSRSPAATGGEHAGGSAVSPRSAVGAGVPRTTSVEPAAAREPPREAPPPRTPSIGRRRRAAPPGPEDPEPAFR